MAGLGPVPAQPAALVPGALPPPAAAVNPLAPTAAEAAVFRQYYLTLVSLRSLAGGGALVTLPELAAWLTYANNAEALSGGIGAGTQAALDRLDCKLTNLQIRMFNARRARNEPLHPLVKERAGAGLPLPGGAAAPVALPAGHPLAVGATIASNVHPEPS